MRPSARIESRGGGDDAASDAASPPLVRVFRQDDLIWVGYSFPQSRGIVAYAALMLLVYPVGVPATFVWLLGRKKEVLKQKEARKDDESVQGIAFLWEAYKPEYW